MVFHKICMVAGGINAALAVGLGAFGAHALKERLPENLLQTFQTGVDYHFYHALGLFAIAVASFVYPETAMVRWAGWVMMAGIVLFSGSLYALVLTGVRSLGIITPFGGVAFIVSWVLLVSGVLKS